MAARQNHGFKFEDDYCKKNNIYQNNNYTGKWDGLDCKNRNLYNIKCLKLNSGLSLGDLFRQSKTTIDFILVLGYYDDDKNKIVKIEKWLVNGKEYNKLFKWDHYAKLKHWINNKVSNDYSYDTQWKEECKEWKEKWDNIPSLNFKRDHGAQRRMQVSISRTNFNKLIKNNKTFTLWEEN